MKRIHIKIILLAALSVCLVDCSDNGSDDTPVVPKDTVVVTKTDSFAVSKINITTDGGKAITGKESSDYVTCSVSVTSDMKDWNYSGTGKIRGRGNSTWLWYPKKPYRIKLDKKASILGLGEDKDWVLLANYRDPTNMMTTFVLNVAAGEGMAYTNHSRFVEVTLNGNYVGLYLLTEQVEQGKNRVNIDDKKGVLLSLDADDGPELSPNNTDNFWSEVYQMPVCVKYPDDVTSTAKTTISADFAKLEKAMQQADYTTVSGMMDIKSFIKYMLIQELIYNVEVAAPRSIYMYKDKGGKWMMGPMWDFDAGFDFDWGTMYTGHTYFTSYQELVLGTDPANHTGYGVPEFFTDMFRSRQFVTEYKAAWKAMKDKIMTDYWSLTDKYISAATDAMARNYTRWPIDRKYDTEITKMKKWLTNRVGYLDKVINNYPSGSK